jgi:Bacterial Ig-like domain
MNLFRSNTIDNFLWCILMALVLSACGKHEGRQQLEVIWENHRATSLSIPKELVNGISNDSLSTIRITVGDTSNESMLGEWADKGGRMLFTPMVPFTHGLRYSVIYKEKVVGSFDVPFYPNSKKPTLSIYPSQDTLPENILKMYFQFTEPMVEGQSLKHVSLLNKNGDTLAGIFLELQPELWNTEGTMLTLWFDPGRIKRDLIPNRSMGNPLKDGERYTLRVSGKWKSKSGLMLQDSYSKSFVASARDEIVPDMDLWKLIEPVSGTTAPVSIYFSEPLDFSLIQSAIHVLDENKETVAGRIQSMNEETGIIFTPKATWEKGNYLLRVELRLEDLAGNNLSRPFDRDLKKEKSSEERKIYERGFVVE